MTVYRIILRSLRRSLPLSASTTTSLIPSRQFAYSSADEAAAARRRAKRQNRMQPPVRSPDIPKPPRPPHDPHQPETTSSLTGPRLNLHNRVQNLIRAEDLDSASVVARQAVFSKTRPTVFTCNAIMAAMRSAKRYQEAFALFSFFFNQSNIVPNVASFNVLINTHCDTGDVDKGLDVYRHIIASAPFTPSAVTYRHLTKGLINAGRISEAVGLLYEMLNKGHAGDSLVYNNLIKGYLDLGNLEKANEFFDELKERCEVYDGIVNATFMDWYFNQGNDKEAMQSYKSLVRRQVKMVPATSNVLLEVFLKHGKKAEAEALFDIMLDNHKTPTFQAVNSDTFNMMVNACFKEGRVSDAIGVFRKVGKAPKSMRFTMTTPAYNNIIMRYCENGMMEDAESLFVEMCSKSIVPDTITYRALINGYFNVGKVDDALWKYVQMVDASLRVIPTYANKWFSQLIEKGKVVECVPILTKMADRDPKPDTISYDIVIRALCKEGHFDASLDLLGQMSRYGVGFSPELKEFVSEVFGKEGRYGDIEKLLHSRFPGYVSHGPLSGPLQMVTGPVRA